MQIDINPKVAVLRLDELDSFWEKVELPVAGLAVRFAFVYAEHAAQNATILYGSAYAIFRGGAGITLEGIDELKTIGDIQNNINGEHIAVWLPDMSIESFVSVVSKHVGVIAGFPTY